MLNELKDGHTNLISTFNMSRYWDWYLDYPDNFDSDIQENYLGRNYSIAGGLKYTTLIDGQIGYIYYGSFSSSAGESGLDHIFYQFKDCKGLICDIRDNGGGMLSNADRIASRFLEEKILTGYIPVSYTHLDVYKRQLPNICYIYTLLAIWRNSVV